MEKDEILEVIEMQLQQMNETDGKSIRRRMGEMRAVVNLLAKLILPQANVSGNEANPISEYKKDDEMIVCECGSTDRTNTPLNSAFCRKCGKDW